MIYRLLNWLRHLGAAEYWRLRAQRAEEQLELEMLRNREREDTFVSAAVMGGRGMFGVAPRGAPAARAPASPTLSPFAGPNGVEEMEWETQYKPDALAHNVPLPQARRDFEAMITRRKTTMNDDPYSM